MVPAAASGPTRYWHRLEYGRVQFDLCPRACRLREGQRGPSVAFTYDDPVVFLEHAVDVADACRARGVRAVAVTAGYVCPEPRAELFAHVDAANVELKGFTERGTRATSTTSRAAARSATGAARA